MSPPTDDEPDPDGVSFVQAIKQVLTEAGFYQGSIDSTPDQTTIDALSELRNAYAASDAALSELLDQRRAWQGEYDRHNAAVTVIEVELQATRTALAACTDSHDPDFNRTDATVGKIIRDAFRAIAAAET